MNRPMAQSVGSAKKNFLILHLYQAIIEYFSPTICEAQDPLTRLILRRLHSKEKTYNENREWCWKTNESGLRKLALSGRLMKGGQCSSL